MAKIDKFIEAALGHGAEEMVLSPGEKIYLVKSGARRTLSSQPVEATHIRSVVGEVVPSQHSGLFESGGSFDFHYLSPGGPVRIAIENGNLVRVHPAELGLAGGNGSGTTGNGSGTGTGSGTGNGIATGNTGGAALKSNSIGDSATSQSTAGAKPNGAGTSAVSGTTSEPGTTNATGGSESGPRALDRLLRRMVVEDCSDLHISAGYPPLFRKDGDIEDLTGEGDLVASDIEALLRELAEPVVWEKFLETHDADFGYEIEGVARFRCNIFCDRQGMGGVFRTIPSVIPTAEQLGLPKVVMDLCDLHKGLVVVTGPTGSGKSTTLAAMVDHINTLQPRHIITIEDPIEFVHPKRKCLINQREIGTHTKGFRAALRAALREDPDIVLLGEMRDLETVEIALETAETGHLVFGTLHTNTAASTVDRIIDQFPSDQQAQIRVLLSETLKGVIAQTLCKKKGGGRVAAQEILLVTPAISNLIREGKTFQIPSLMQTGRGLGMQTLDTRLLQLVQEGIVEVEEAYAKSLTKNEFKSILERAGVGLPKAA